MMYKEMRRKVPLPHGALVQRSLIHLYAGSLSEEEGGGGEGESGSEREGGGGEGEEDKEEEEWRSLQETMKVQQEKKKELGAHRDSHPVHAPFFPDVGHMTHVLLVT